MIHTPRAMIHTPRRHSTLQACESCYLAISPRRAILTSGNQKFYIVLRIVVQYVAGTIGPWTSTGTQEHQKIEKTPKLIKHQSRKNLNLHRIQHPAAKECNKSKIDLVLGEYN